MTRPTLAVAALFVAWHRRRSEKAGTEPGQDPQFSADWGMFERKKASEYSGEQMRRIRAFVEAALGRAPRCIAPAPEMTPRRRPASEHEPTADDEVPHRGGAGSQCYD